MATTRVPRRHRLAALTVTVIALVGGCKTSGTAPVVGAGPYRTTLSDGTVLITLSNSGQTIPAHIGTLIDIDLKLRPGDEGYHPPNTSDRSILAPGTMSTPNMYEQRATFRAVRIGQAQIFAKPPPQPKCLPNCSVPQYTPFYVTVVVR